jgi:phosphoheptose isomerase
MEVSLLPYQTIDLKEVQTYPIRQRRNLVTTDDLVDLDASPPPFESRDMDEVVGSIQAARLADRPVIWMMGAHVIKCGLGPLVVDLMRRGIITHVAGNGAVSIHDLEIALIGQTSEAVATSIEDGTFGMAEETGAMIHRALRQGARDGIGYGEAVGRLIVEEDLPYREHSVLGNAYQLRVPMTIHLTIGADIIHQHPDCDFGMLGQTSGLDFRIFCASVAALERGVFLNFGSAVTGPEVFLKALSIARNLGYTVQDFTTANFDLIPLRDYRAPVAKDNPDYYYRPRKNIVIRPVSLGGRGYHIQGDHRQTIPNLYHAVREMQGGTLARKPVEPTSYDNLAAVLRRVKQRSLRAAASLRRLVARRPDLEEACAALGQAYLLIASSLERGGTLFLCGNGGSMGDALHISGELLKSYTSPRPLSQGHRARLVGQPDGRVLSQHLEEGLRAIVLGVNPSLASAVANDFVARGMGFAQHLHALARPGDVLLGISTSAQAQNVSYAASAARALGLAVIALTGERGGPLVERADVVIRAPAEETNRVQEEHVALYHCLCEMLERDFFGEDTE